MLSEKHKETLLFPIKNLDASRRFYQTAIFSMMTLGAGWGTYLLIKLYFVKEFTQLNLFEINAHGQAQIYGWIAMMLIGSTYLALPRLFQMQMPYPKLTTVVWGLMTIGVLASTLGLLLKGTWGITILGGMSLIAATLVFSLQCLVYFRRLQIRSSIVLYVKTALFFLVLSSIYSFWHHCSILGATEHASALAQVATFQAPLRDIQVHGMGLFMVFAMLQWFIWQPDQKLSYRAWVWICTGVIGEIVLFLSYRFTHNHHIAALLILPWLCLMIGSVLLLIRGKVMFNAPLFVRVACLWLLLSEAMLVLLPLYSVISHLTFSHAYYGAIRHAVTVGFLSQMILGMAPRLFFKDLSYNPRAANAAFILLNLGCFLRVSLQIATDFVPAAFSLISISGTLEFCAIVVWGLPLLLAISRKNNCQHTPI